MDGFHDLGGIQGFGPVPHKINSLSYKPVFKQEWEHLAYSLMFLGAGHMGLFSIDEVRHAVERIGLRQHVGTQYYERYIIATASLLVEKGIITQAELDAELGKPFQLASLATSQGRNTIPVDRPFEVGERVRVKDERVSGHIRVPAYCRGKEGVILHRTTEKWPFPDAIGHGDQSALHQPTYHVQFSSRELWGDAGDEGSIIVDLFEGYLERSLEESNL